MAIRVRRTDIRSAILALQDVCVDQTNPSQIRAIRRALCQAHGIERTDYSRWWGWNETDLRRLLGAWALETTRNYYK